MARKYYSKIVQNPDDYSHVADALEYFDAELDKASAELNPHGRIEEIARSLPGIVEFRFGQLQEIEAIMNYLERKEDKVKGDIKRNYLENYNRAISERLADQYASIEKEVLNIRQIREEVSLVRNKFLAISKGLEYLHFQITNIVKLRVAGIEDAELTRR
jgi:hypothetical protein